MRTAEEGGFGHPAMVDGGIWGGVEGRGGVPPVWEVPELVVWYAHGSRSDWGRRQTVGKIRGGVVVVPFAFASVLQKSQSFKSRMQSSCSKVRIGISGSSCSSVPIPLPRWIH